MATDHVQRLLIENSTERYYLTYNNFFINHMSHAIIALGRLDASDERLNRFVNWYGPQLDPGRALGYVEPQDTTNQTVSQLLGKYRGYYQLVDFYENKFNNEYSKSLKNFIIHEFPALAPGLGGGAFHGIIHLGYGYAAKNWRIVIEGMAFLHYLFQRPILSDATLSGPIAEGVEDPLKILSELQQRKDIYAIGYANPVDPKKGSFTSILEGILANKKTCQDLFEYVKRIKLPKVDEKNSLGDILVNLCLTIYVESSRRNDFFLLHGGTSSWALKQILPLFNDNPRFTSFLYHAFMLNLLATYFGVTTPDMNSNQLSDASTKEYTWNQIIERLFSEDFDEHIFKIVQVARDMKKEHPENENLYKIVALNALDHKFAHVASPYPRQKKIYSKDD